MIIFKNIANALKNFVQNSDEIYLGTDAPENKLLKRSEVVTEIDNRILGTSFYGDSQSFQLEKPESAVSATNPIKIIESVNINEYDAGFSRGSAVWEWARQFGLMNWEVTNDLQFGRVFLDKNRQHGTFYAPYTGNIVNSISKIRGGVKGVIIHASGTAPTFPAIWVKKTATDYLTTANYNLIFYEVISERMVMYEIIHISTSMTWDRKSGLICQLDFEEESGLRIKDSSGNGMDAFIATFNAEYTRDNVLGYPRFNHNVSGSTSRPYIRVPYNEISRSLKRITIGGLVTFNNTSSTGLTLFSTGGRLADATRGVEVAQQSPATQLASYINRGISANTYRALSGNVLVEGDVKHVMMTYDETTNILYVDGVEVANIAAASQLITDENNPIDWYIGARHVSTTPGQGEATARVGFSQFCAWSRALTAAEVAMESKRFKL